MCMEDYPRTLNEFIKRFSTEDACFEYLAQFKWTDGWNGYNALSENGYRHTVAKSHELKICHLIASLLKRWLLGSYQGAVRFQHLDYYLDEFTFRFNRRTSVSRAKLFYRLIQQAVATEPVISSDIIGGKHIACNEMEDQNKCEDATFLNHNMRYAQESSAYPSLSY